MANGTYSFDPLGWAVGLLGTISLLWVGTTSKKTAEHSTKIAVLETQYVNIKESLDRIEDHIGSKPRE